MKKAVEAARIIEQRRNDCYQIEFDWRSGSRRLLPIFSFGINSLRINFGDLPIGRPTSQRIRKIYYVEAG